MKPLLWRSQRPVAFRNYPMMSLFDEMNRFFEDVIPGASSEQGVKALGQFSPKIDVKENPNEFILTGEFPGMEDKEITLELSDNTLTLSGEKKSEHEHKEGEKVYVERTYGSFSRTIPFQVEIDEDNARAEMKNGVLTIHIPKSSKAVRGAKKLTIKKN